MKKTVLLTGGSRGIGKAILLLLKKDKYIVFDAGDGIYKLNKYVKDDKKPIFLFLSHLHLDHIYKK